MANPNDEYRCAACMSPLECRVITGMYGDYFRVTPCGRCVGNAYSDGQADTEDYSDGYEDGVVATQKAAKQTTGG